MVASKGFTYKSLSIFLDKITKNVLTKHAPYASKFQLIEKMTYLFLSISLDKVTISVLTKHATCF